MIRLFRRLPLTSPTVPSRALSRASLSRALSLALLLSTAAPVVALAQDAAPAPAAASSEASPAPVAPTPDAAPSAEAPAASAPTLAGAPSNISNPYGLSALWESGGIVSRGVLLILVSMSLGTWYIMITKFFEQSRLLSAARAANRYFWAKPTLQEGAATLKTSSPFRYIAETGIVAAEHHEGTMQESIDLSDWTASQIHRAVDSVQSDLQSGLAFLGTVGSTSPFVGLFGTVWGIYNALTAIGIAGQASIDKVAGPVGEALIMTAIGLGTAVPAVLGYNLLVRRNKTGMEQVRNFAADLQSILIGGFRHGTIRSGTSVAGNDRTGSSGQTVG